MREYLIAHPEVLQDAMAELERRQTAAEAETGARKTPVETCLALTPWLALGIGVVLALFRPGSLLIAAPLFLATIPLAPAIFRLVGHAPDIACLEALYFQTLTFGAGATLCAAAFSSFSRGSATT